MPGAGEEQIVPMEGLKAEGPALPQGSQLQQMLNVGDELKLGFSSQDGRGTCAGAHRRVWSPNLALSSSPTPPPTAAIFLFEVNTAAEKANLGRKQEA